MVTPEQRPTLLARLRSFPDDLEAAVSGLTDEQLDFTPAEGEWSIRQVVHHLGDAHMNGIVRMKWALTEAQPAIKGYDQVGFAGLSDSMSGPIEVSLRLVRALHERWLLLLEALDESQWARTLVHPQRGTLTVSDLLQVYADHCDNHLRQIAQNKAAMEG